MLKLEFTLCNLFGETIQLLNIFISPLNIINSSTWFSVRIITSSASQIRTKVCVRVI